ncbi:MAG TPA: hypothetical protein VKD90_02015 [Gemmataceae bacterium]|nr:hypothetical protein [Gemmataceae bacterium]
MDLNARCTIATGTIPAGKSRWKYDPKVLVNGGWVLLGCNCTGKCCRPPATAGFDGQEMNVDCVDCPDPTPGGDSSPPQAD